ncbi:hypothetical protein H5410_006594 [Solanum commersonii]|uniref:Uncharacterized protein n=1 Tax=Solanum commersonii TaxID=4109 RepID=A0A9J6AAA1_SOLCO|nr:hypothetical protein H5410_006594 [Solanum commersonii]
MERVGSERRTESSKIRGEVRIKNLRTNIEFTVIIKRSKRTTDLGFGSYIGNICAAIMAATATGLPPFEAVHPAPPPQTTTYATLFNFNTINSKQSVLIN